ncbi:butyrophilin subfamily 2 member A1-like [Tympanuchus pallidicinctus]|uniref:butyrophilin subfamily 2 member A1-like n=1 Tax=Tympanuchus pallidicinctus TaxID=109042 RepID=UPI0022873FFE|nr:butyrophilin subfamily 2 member A1-like [Tympanuchus pallidicinctus]XP_052561146.1 butyrophilin subfamily 2 member A1-like [Tympanuchus pallidicinctus]XP_052561148.1 butyrophilin subfamily 2 member A1-like [Tympanuchus pallidicinctus]
MLGFPSWMLTPFQVLAFQHLSCLITGQFISSSPRSSITGVIGEGVILPCYVVAENIPEIFSVQWIFNGQSEKITVSTYHGKNKNEKQDERYQGRIELFHSEFKTGNMSLHLKNIRSSDKGLYTCVVSFNNEHHDELIELQVAAKGGVPSIFLRSPRKEGIGLTCHADGWFPKPEVIWLDGQGQIRKELSTTKVMMMPSGLYSVLSSMNLIPGSDMEVSCRIVNNLLKTMSESRVLISDIFFPSISKWPAAYLVILCAIAVLICVVFFKLKSNHKRTINSVKLKKTMEEENEQLKLMLEQEKATNRREKSKLKGRFGKLKAELDFWEAQSYAVPITVNPECQLLEIQVPGAPDVESNATEPADLSSPSTIPVLVAKEGFASGKHYWEVDVGQQQDWVLGVMRQKGKQEEQETLAREDFWALQKSKGDIFSIKGNISFEKKEMNDSVIGVLLDLEEAQINFYEAHQMSTMVKIPISLGKEPTEMFFPFLSKGGEADTPVIHPVLTPVPLEPL